MQGLSDRAKIDIYAGKGAVFHGGSSRQGLPLGAGGRRGAISGWSSASRRRMREFLVSHTFPEGWCCYGVTLTVPGEDVDEVMKAGASGRSFFDECVRQFGQAIKGKLGGGMVWRKELQVRKMPHLHGLVILPEKPFYTFQGKAFPFQEYVKWLWFHYIDRILPLLSCPMRDGVPEMFVKEAEKWGKYSGWWKVHTMGGCAYNWRPEWARHCIPWAWRYCVNVQGNGSKGAWLRYLQDHATKSKQAQVMESGRNWAVVGRSRFQAASMESVDLSVKQYAQVIRYQGRLATPQVKKPGVVFGRALGFKCYRGRLCCGSAVTFTRSEIVQKMIDRAIIEYPEKVAGYREGSIRRIIQAVKWGYMAKRGQK